MSKLFTVAIESIISLSPEGAVEIARSILRAECGYAKLSPSVLTISSRLTVADGGIDAEINTELEAKLPSDVLFKSGLTGFQIKSGTSFTPWTKGTIRSELLNTKGNLPSEVDRLLKNDGRYTLYCTGHDLTPQQRNASRAHIIEVFNEKGFNVAEEKIEILGASQIAEYAERYPGTASLLTRDPIQEAWTLAEWERDAHMANAFYESTEQSAMIEQIRGELQRDAKHVRILGEPGLGKTRLVLEALRDESLSNFVLYFHNGTQFEQTKLFRQLIKSEDDKPFILILDDLPESALLGIWRHLKPRCGCLKIISLDHGKDKTEDEGIIRLSAPSLPDETIRKILLSRVVESTEIDRWVRICEGSPRVAQAVADNLYSNPGDILKPPSTVPLWTRFLHGHSKREESLARQVDCVACHLSLFSRFGYEDPVGAEAKYIAKLVEKMDSSIGWARFQEIIQDLRDRRVLQGNRTLFFVPKALHIYLWKEFWSQYGRGFNFTDTFVQMPESLHAWFFSMFKYSGEDTARDVVGEILRVDGIFSDQRMIFSVSGSRLISILAEANPGAVLKLLELTIAKWTDQELASFKENRQNIVWALEKIAVWPSNTVRAIDVLARLALTESSHYSNNAKGTLIGLFKIGVESAVTESSPELRLPALLKLLRSPINAERELGVEAMSGALSVGLYGSRMVGPEYQGLKERAKLWKPDTYGDWWDVLFTYFKVFVDESHAWPEEIRPDADIALFESANKLIIIETCTDLAIQVLEGLAHQSVILSADWSRLFRHWSDSEQVSKHPLIAQKIRSFKRRHSQRDLASRFQRYVMDVNYMDLNEESRDRRNLPKNRAKTLISILAREVVRQLHGFKQISHLLQPSLRSPGVWYFGKELAQHDVGFKLLPDLIQYAQEKNHDVCLQGYLAVLKSSNSVLYDETLNSLLLSKETANIGVNISLRAVYDHDHFTLCLEALEKGWASPRLYSLVAIGGTVDLVSSDKILKLINYLDRDGSEESWCVLIEILNAISFDALSLFSPGLVLRVVSKDIPERSNNGQMGRYFWKKICLKLCDWDSSQSLPLLDMLLAKMGESYKLCYDSDVSSLADHIVKADPSGAWRVIKQHFEESLPQSRYNLQDWLKGGLIGFGEEAPRGAIVLLPVEEIVSWIDEERSSRAPLIAYATSGMLEDDNGGKLTRELLCRYSEVEGVKNRISLVFNSGGWDGSESIYLKKKRDKLRHWLADGFEVEVIHWIESEIEYLDRRIFQAEIDEERSRFE